MGLAFFKITSKVFDFFNTLILFHERINSFNGNEKLAADIFGHILQNICKLTTKLWASRQ